MESGKGGIGREAREWGVVEMRAGGVRMGEAETGLRGAKNSGDAGIGGDAGSV